jgi:diadenosine tetraphosphatase ApaH/serine/threonine PP2A family protein phosphatase
MTTTRQLKLGAILSGVGGDQNDWHHPDLPGDASIDEDEVELRRLCLAGIRRQPIHHAGYLRRISSPAGATDAGPNVPSTPSLRSFTSTSVEPPTRITPIPPASFVLQRGPRAGHGG